MPHDPDSIFRLACGSSTTNYVPVGRKDFRFRFIPLCIRRFTFGSMSNSRNASRQCVSNNRSSGFRLPPHEGTEGLHPIFGQPGQRGPGSRLSRWLILNFQ